MRGRKKVYDLVIDDTRSIRVTVTRQPETAHEWVSAFLPVQGTFLTVGVAVHDEDGEAQVMTLCLGHEALVFKLSPTAGMLQPEMFKSFSGTSVAASIGAQMVTSMYLRENLQSSTLETSRTFRGITELMV